MDFPATSSGSPLLLKADSRLGSIPQLNYAGSAAIDTIDPVKLQQWQTTQANLVQSLVFKPLDIPNLRTVAGVDISFSLTTSNAVASLIIFSYPLTHRAEAPLYADFHTAEMTEPYCAGYLAFRELPLLEVLFARLRETRPELYPPDVTLVDGNGVWHPRGLGSASHLGVVLDIATIGVAKNFFHIPDAGIGDATFAALQEDEEEVRGTDGKTYGAAIRTGGSKKHVFVSCGHRVDLRSAVEVVKACSFYRIPEPVRRADLESRRVIREEGI
jgi:deoxyinosine 3'endonuclease (endonuclease V)